MFSTLCRYQEQAHHMLAQYLQPLVLLAIRLYVAKIFFDSGLLKLESFLNDDWASTVYLFEEVTKVPFLPAELAAYLAMFGELVFSVLLAFGLLGRFAALSLLLMTVVIEWSWQYSDPEYVTDPDHEMWGLMLLTILAFGAGKFSLDALCRRWCMRAKTPPTLH